MKICIIGNDNKANFLVRSIKGLEKPASATVTLIKVNDKSFINHEFENEKETTFNVLNDALNYIQPNIVYLYPSTSSYYKISKDVLQHGRSIVIIEPGILRLDEYLSLQEIALNNQCILRIFNQYSNDNKIIDYVKSINYEHELHDRNVVININHDINNTELLKYVSPNALSDEYDYPGSIFHKDIFNSLFILIDIIGPVTGVSVREMCANLLPQNITDNLIVTCTGKCGVGVICIAYNHEKDNYNIVSKCGSSDVVFNYSDAHKAIYSNNNKSMELLSAMISDHHQLTNDEDLYVNKLIPEINKNTDSIYIRKINAVFALCEKIWPLIVNAKLDFTPLIPDYHIDDMNTPCVLVTGATGALGKVLSTQLLDNKFKVRALARKLSKINNIREDMEIFYGDISDPASLEKAFINVDYVVHAAADTMATKVDNDVTTISGTRNIVDLCKKQNIKKLIYISTCNVYNTAYYESGYQIDEKSPLEVTPELRGSYTYTKSKAESIIQNEIRSGAINAICLRPGTYLGQNCDYFTALIGFSVKHKLFVTIGHKKQVLPLVCIDNVADAIKTMLGNDLCDGGTYNIIDGDNVTKEQYIKMFIKKLYPDSIWIHLPYNFMYFSIALQEYIFNFLGIKPVLTKYRYKASQNNVVYKSDKIYRDLLWDPPYKLQDMMSRIVERANVKENKGITR